VFAENTEIRKISSKCAKGGFDPTEEIDALELSGVVAGFDGGPVDWRPTGRYRREREDDPLSHGRGGLETHRAAL